MRFWDTSALISFILGQNAAQELDAIVESDDALAVWWGTGLEALSAVMRLARGGHIGAERQTRALEQISNALGRAHEVPPTEELRDEAHRAVRIHTITAGDALQLAAALICAEHRTRGMGFVCLDERLREAARREGFEVLPK